MDLHEGLGKSVGGGGPGSWADSSEDPPTGITGVETTVSEAKAEQSGGYLLQSYLLLRILGRRLNRGKAYSFRAVQGKEKASTAQASGS